MCMHVVTCIYTCKQIYVTSHTRACTCQVGSEDIPIVANKIKEMVKQWSASVLESESNSVVSSYTPTVESTNKADETLLTESSATDCGDEGCEIIWD
jgi:hypothetical protein